MGEGHGSLSHLLAFLSFLESASEEQTALLGSWVTLLVPAGSVQIHHMPSNGCFQPTSLLMGVELSLMALHLLLFLKFSADS